MSRQECIRDGFQVARRPCSSPAFDTVQENRQGDRPVQERHNSTFEINLLNGTHSTLLSKELTGFGEPRRKKLIGIADIVAVVVSLALFAMAFIKVLSCTSVLWKLDLTRHRPFAECDESVSFKPRTKNLCPYGSSFWPFLSPEFSLL